MRQNRHSFNGVDPLMEGGYMKRITVLRFGKPSPESDMKTCHPCHQAVKDRDFVFTRYTP